jgi:phosphate-selective porin
VVIAAWVPANAGAQTGPPKPTPPTQPAARQSANEPPPPDTDYAEPVLKAPSPIPATGFFMPDVPDSWNTYPAYDGNLFSTRFNFAAIIDYNAFIQDSDNETQVGEQRDEWDVRTVRLMFRGQLKFTHPIGYFFSVEVKGRDHAETGDAQIGLSKLGFTDWEFNTQLGTLGTLKYGKVKEPFVYEMVGDAANLQQQERAISPFFRSRGIGFRLGRPFADDSMTWSVGWFNDWWVEDQAFDDSGNDFAARLTGVPYWADNGSSYLHLGISARYVGKDEGTLRFRGRPESNVTDYYVDSGNVVGDHANELGLESVWGSGPFFMTAEYARAWVDAPESGDPRFWGTYVTLSCVLTGEHRPYDRKVAYARRIMPATRWGAWEIVGRYSHVDISDQLVDGGVMDRGTIGLNWWATRRWKIGFDYGVINLDRGGLNGLTHAFHTRLQWAF